jgi:hypothetical protein
MGEEIITATNKITTFRKFKDIMIDMLRGYPEYEYFGKFESVFPKTGKKIVEILIRQEIIERIPINDVKKRIEMMTLEEQKKLPPGEDRLIWYCLTPRGVDLAVSMVDLEYSEKMKRYNKQTLNYSKKMNIFTIVIIVFGLLTLGLEILTYLQK